MKKTSKKIIISKNLYSFKKAINILFDNNNFESIEILFYINNFFIKKGLALSKYNLYKNMKIVFIIDKLKYTRFFKNLNMNNIYFYNNLKYENQKFKNFDLFVILSDKIPDILKKHNVLHYSNMFLNVKKKKTYKNIKFIISLLKNSIKYKLNNKTIQMSIGDLGMKKKIINSNFLLIKNNILENKLEKKHVIKKVFVSLTHSSSIQLDLNEFVL